MYFTEHESDTYLYYYYIRGLKQFLASAKALQKTEIQETI